jgi:DNA-binding IclR family transcriptional regulator
MSLDTATIAQIANPILRGLADRFSQVAYITQLISEEVRLATYVLPSNSKHAVVFPGHIFPIHASANAKATFAFQSPELIKRQLRKPLEKLQSATKTDPDAVRAELSEVRKRGYAVGNCEVESSVFAVACPIRSAHSDVIFAVGINGTVREMRAIAPVADYAEALKRAADELARLI